MGSFDWETKTLENWKGAFTKQLRKENQITSSAKPLKRMTYKQIYQLMGQGYGIDAQYLVIGLN